MEPLVGVWRLIEARAFDGQERELPSPLGPQPMGVAVITDARIMAVGGDGRMVLPPAIKRAFAAYSGEYTFDGTTLVTHVDAASDADILEDQVRNVRFDGPRRMIVVPVSRLFGKGGGLELVWERCG